MIVRHILVHYFSLMLSELSIEGQDVKNESLPVSVCVSQFICKHPISTTMFKVVNMHSCPNAIGSFGETKLSNASGNGNK
ncbi:hypothetical protein Y032_0142g2283 [Ancylostoma ceylanicum]|uniref:Uncharacterized protein n=1 Tax=Ancylostoma ceylanicum TaxID=53326 RepID=A0A016T3L8_9BILA|nr:hypothetical protein Y032_0142g2283 [Ancylostoma ceylanicum]